MPISDVVRRLAVLAAFAAAGARAQDVPLNCRIQPSQVIDLAAPVPGVAVEVPVRPGQTVSAGDLVVRIDTAAQEIEAAIARQRAGLRGGLMAAEARRDAARSLVDMLTRARAARAASQERLDEAERDLALAEADIIREREALDLAAAEARRADALIERARVLAPVDAILGEELISVGEAAGQGPVARLFVAEPKRVEVFVPAAALPAFLARPEHVVEAGGARRPVALDYVSPVADLSSGTVSVYFTLSDTEVLPGTRCTVPA